MSSTIYAITTRAIAIGTAAVMGLGTVAVSAASTVDELNATIGIARLHDQILGADLTASLARIQNDLFDLGADLCRPEMEKDGEAGYTVLRMADSQVARLEAEIDAMNARLEPLRSFILPGGSPRSGIDIS